jgi:2-dehydropantoate 2-reductase
MWEITDNMGPYKTSTMLDLINRRPMEVKYLFRRPLEIADKLHIAAPKLEALTAQIEGLQRHYDLF